MADNIRNAILKGNENTERRLRLKREECLLSLQEELEQYNKYLETYHKLKKVFAGSEMENRVDEVVALLLDKPVSKKVLYINSLKRFGKIRGVSTYKGIKSLYEEEKACGS